MKNKPRRHRTSQPFGEIPRRLVFWGDPDHGRRYELWRTPEVKPGWHLYTFEDGVEISRLPVPSETRGRIEFESRVAQWVEEN